MSFKVKALYDYASGHDDDLNFSTGQIITVTDQDDDDWYGGEYIDAAGTKQEGIFPRNFVEKYEPTAPPRPTRARPKKEAEPAAAPAPPPVVEAPAPAAPPPDSPQHSTPEAEEAPEPVAVASPSATFSAPPPVPAAVAEPPAPKPVHPVLAPVPALALTPPAPQPAEVVSPPIPKAAPLPPKASGPPPVSEKPTTSSFKDRIAAFNKAAAPPVTPFKPSNLSSGGGGFIKKPFVAPPPSRNAFIPPPTQAPVAKIYRRDEDPEVKEQEAEAVENAGRVGLGPSAAPTNEGEADDDQPKPMSLKERLALLQKQQMETAARHAEAAAKKEKPKRPPKKRADSQEAVEGEAAERPEEAGRASLDDTHPPRIAHPPRRRSKGAEPRDGNEADMSGAGETTEGLEDLTEKDDSDARVQHAPAAGKEEAGEEEEDEEEDEEDEEEEEVDPEVRRREELRARMAKMSGGMGMPGMAMPLFGAPAPMLPKKKKAAPEKRVEEAEEPVSPVARAAPVPLPGLMRAPPPPAPEPKHPEPEEEEEDEESSLTTPHQESAPPGRSIPTA